MQPQSFQQGLSVQFATDSFDADILMMVQEVKLGLIEIVVVCLDLLHTHGKYVAHSTKRTHVASGSPLPHHMSATRK